MAKKEEDKKQKHSWGSPKPEPVKKEGYSQEKADKDLESHPKFKKFQKGEK